MSTTEAQRNAIREQIKIGIDVSPWAAGDLLDDIDTLRAALRRIAEVHKIANGPCMTADDACPCPQCEAGRIGE